MACRFAFLYRLPVPSSRVPNVASVHMLYLSPGQMGRKRLKVALKKEKGTYDHPSREMMMGGPSMAGPHPGGDMGAGGPRLGPSGLGGAPAM